MTSLENLEKVLTELGIKHWKFLREGFTVVVIDDELWFKNGELDPEYNNVGAEE